MRAHGRCHRKLNQTTLWCGWFNLWTLARVQTEISVIRFFLCPRFQRNNNNIWNVQKVIDVHMMAMGRNGCHSNSFWVLRLTAFDIFFPVKESLLSVNVYAFFFFLLAVIYFRKYCTNQISQYKFFKLSECGVCETLYLV